MNMLRFVQILFFCLIYLPLSVDYSTKCDIFCLNKLSHMTVK